MGIFTIPATSNVCELLSTMRDKEIIFPTTEADWKAWSACDVGAKIAAIAPVVSENYEYVVLDWSDNCVKRAPKPVVPATYDSNLLAPWTGYIRWAGNLSGGASPDNHPEFNMTLPEFTTDVYLMASWTIGKNSAATIEWYPKGPDPATGIGYVNLVASGEVISLPSWTGAYHGRTFTRRLYVKANTAGLKLGIWHNCISGNGYVRMSAVAFKVY
jgi:hypothetical protein